jgi:hypothetical protein
VRSIPYLSPSHEYVGANGRQDSFKEEVMSSNNVSDLLSMSNMDHPVQSSSSNSSPVQPDSALDRRPTDVFGNNNDVLWKLKQVMGKEGSAENKNTSNTEVFNSKFDPFGTQNPTAPQAPSTNQFMTQQ